VDTFIEELLIPRINYWVYVLLLLIGLYAMITKNNLIKKLIGMSIFQTAIILFYVSLSVKSGATIPILEHHGSHDAGHAEVAEEGHHEPAHDSHYDEHAGQGSHDDYGGIDPTKYANPLPHVLMLTAIVVGVGTLGVALAVTQLIYRDYGSIEEDEILERIKYSNPNQEAREESV